MPLLFVASSKSLAEWGASVGLTKHIYKVGLTDAAKEKIAETLNAGKHAGREDWKLLAQRPGELDDEAEIIERVCKRERLISPDIYPGIKGAPGIFKVKPENVENFLVVQAAMADEALKNTKIRPAEIGAYLLEVGLGSKAEAED
ncbi:hypothetical protein [Bosea sp. (in: a-proteobacteria)]|uniref:hypothetical protein n=1 Tax=Bosea sp. (in: a-proteobacteria) TaxID=1871050 RepID=UPI0025BD7578|nr:hypothetical protein [Bosea sp. (in: a-proteobacteria)]